MIDKITCSMEPTNDKYLFHDSRKDAREIAKAMNIVIEKVNEVIEKVNEVIEKVNHPDHSNLLDADEHIATSQQPVNIRKFFVGRDFSINDLERMRTVLNRHLLAGTHDIIGEIMKDMEKSFNITRSHNVKKPGNRYYCNGTA